MSTEVAGARIHPGHWIDGERMESHDTFEVRSPIDGRLLANIARGGKPEVDAAVDAAKRAFPAWAGLGAEGRAPILRRFADAILAKLDVLAAVETEDNGSLLTGNRARMIPRAALNVSFFADWALKLNRQTIDSPEVTNLVRFEPAGVAALVSPWNAPLMLLTWKVGPALASGNPVVAKPPEWAPLTASMLAEIALEASVPPGVLNVVQGIGEEAGAALVSHPGVDRISFTGSTDTARIIGKAAAENLTPVSFELGGKSPFLVFEDADLGAAAQTIAGQYFNAGQVCLAGTRILVQRSIEKKLREKVAALVAKIEVGDPRKPTTAVGPLITPEHFRRVCGFVERARDTGAKIAWGGDRDPAGDLYYQPTLVENVMASMEIFQKEVFGPVLAWIPFGDEPEGIRLANATDYGLAAMIFTRNEERARRVAEAVVAGTAWVNCFFIRELAAPFGGARKSGIGREGGTWSFDFFCDVKNVAVRKGSFAPT